MGQTLTAFDAVLKDFYGSDITDEVNKRTRALDLFTDVTDKDMVGGRQVLYPARLGRNEGVGSIAEAANLPTASNQLYDDWKIPFRYTYGRIQLTAQVIKQSLTSKMAFKQALSSEMQYLVEDLARERNRQIQGYGTGALCLSNGAQVNQQTFNVKSAGGLATAQTGLASSLTNAARYIRKNQILAAVTSGGAFNAILGVVSSVASNLQSVTLSAAPTASLNDGDLIVRASLSTSSVIGDTAYNNEVMGLLGLVDDSTLLTTLHNLSRSTYPILKSHVLNLGANLSLDDIQLLADAMYIRGGGTPKKWMSELTVRRAYLGLMITQREYFSENGKANSHDAGYKGLALEKDIEYGGLPWVVDQDAPYGIAFALDTTGFKHFVNTPGEWADDDGTILLRLSGSDVYEGRYRIFDNFHNEHPNRCGRIENIQTPAPPTIPSF